MRFWYQCLVEDPFRYKRPVHLYMILAAICFMTSFLGSFPIFLPGNKTALWNPFFGTMISVYLDIPLLFGVSIGVLFVYPLTLLAFYLIAIFCRNYLPLIMAAFFDVVYSTVIVIAMIYNGGFSDIALLMIISIFVNLCFGIYFVSVRKYLKQERKLQEIA